MKGKKFVDYHNYDQINLTVKRQNADEVILSYGTFLWKETERREDKQYHDILHLSFERPHKIPNKDRLQLLQVHYEQCINSRALVENKRHSKSQVLFVTAAVLFFSAILGILALIFYLRSAFAIAGGAAFVVLQCSLSVWLLFKAKKTVSKEKEKFLLKCQEIDGFIEKILSEAKLLTGVQHEGQ